MYLPKFKVVGDPKNPSRFSSSIIIESINKAAKNLELYSDDGMIVVYDCIGNRHGYKADALITCYETIYPQRVIQNIGNTPNITVSKDNLMFALMGGGDYKNTTYVHLGVDTSIWKPVKRRKDDKFVVLSYTESLARSGLEILVKAFANAFAGQNDCQLFIKDRNGTEEFKKWIYNQAKELNINLRYENRHISDIEEVRDIFSQVDCHAYLNRSTTWGMTVLEGMACGLPTIAPAFSGPKEYIIDKFNGFNSGFSLERIVDSLPSRLLEGQRNYFFPNTQNDFWCVPNCDNVTNQLIMLKNDKQFRNYLGSNAITTAENFTWERSALMIAESLNRFYPY